MRYNYIRIGYYAWMREVSRDQRTLYGPDISPQTTQTTCVCVCFVGPPGTRATLSVSAYHPGTELLRICYSYRHAKRNKMSFPRRT